MFAVFVTLCICYSEAIVPLHTLGNLYIIGSHKYPTDPLQAYRNQRTFQAIHGPRGVNLVEALGDGSLVYLANPHSREDKDEFETTIFPEESRDDELITVYPSEILSQEPSQERYIRQDVPTSIINDNTRNPFLIGKLHNHRRSFTTTKLPIRNSYFTPLPS